jgi:KUP system potassium uptake protein
VRVEPLGHQFYRVDVHYGFKDERDVPHALELCGAHGLPFQMMSTSFFMLRQTVTATSGAGMSLWRKALFAAYYRNARHAARYYRIPANRVL